MARKQDTDFGINRITTAMAVAVVVALAVAVAVAVAIADLVTETVTSEAVLQKAKREQRDQLQAIRSRLLCGWSPRQSAPSHRRHDLGFGTSQV
jgi:hypothetical protein